MDRKNPKLVNICRGYRVHIIRPAHNSKKMTAKENVYDKTGVVIKEGSCENGGWFEIRLDNVDADLRKRRGRNRRKDIVHVRRGSLEVILKDDGGIDAADCEDLLSDDSMEQEQNESYHQHQHHHNKNNRRRSSTILSSISTTSNDHIDSDDSLCEEEQLDSENSDCVEDEIFAKASEKYEYDDGFDFGAKETSTPELVADAQILASIPSVENMPSARCEDETRVRTLGYRISRKRSRPNRSLVKSTDLKYFNCSKEYIGLPPSFFNPILNPGSNKRFQSRDWWITHTE